MFRKTFLATAVAVSCLSASTSEAQAGQRGRQIAAGILEAIARGLAPQPQPQPWPQPQPQPLPQPWPQPMPQPQPADVIYDSENAMPGYPLNAQLPVGATFVKKSFKLRVQQQVVTTTGIQTLPTVVLVERWVYSGMVVPPQPQPVPQPQPQPIPTPQPQPLAP